MDLRLGSNPQKTEQAHKTQHDFFQSVHDDMADYYFNPQTADWAPDLEVNSIKSKIEKHRLMRLQKKAENSLITQDLKSGFPEYHRILANYSKSRIFAHKYQTIPDK